MNEGLKKILNKIILELNKKYDACMKKQKENEYFEAKAMSYYFVLDILKSRLEILEYDTDQLIKPIVPKLK